MTRIIKRALLTGSALAVVLGPIQASAGTQTSNLSVTSTIAANCTITTAAVAFGAYDPIGANASSPLNGTGTVTTTCTTGSAPVITLGQGITPTGGSTDTVPVRQMINGANKLGYFLYQDSGHSSVWGNTAGTAPTSVAGSGLPQTFTVYGQVTAGQNLPAGSYSDTVVATVTF